MYVTQEMWKSQLMDSSRHNSDRANSIVVYVSLFQDTVSTSHHMASIGSTIKEQWTEKDVEGDWQSSNIGNNTKMLKLHLWRN
jgi:hypothetical protein